MKTKLKHCLQDSLSVSEKGRAVHVYRDGNRIVASVWKEGGNTHAAYHEFTFNQFANFLERLREGIAGLNDE